MFRGPSRFNHPPPVSNSVPHETVETSSADSFNQAVKPYTVASPPTRRHLSSRRSQHCYRHTTPSTAGATADVASGRYTSDRRSPSHFKGTSSTTHRHHYRRRLSASSTSSNDSLSSYSTSSTSSSSQDTYRSSQGNRYAHSASARHRSHRHDTKAVNLVRRYKRRSRKGAGSSSGLLVRPTYDPMVPASQMYIPSKAKFIAPKASYIPPAVAPYVQPQSVYSSSSSQPLVYTPSNTTAVHAPPQQSAAPSFTPSRYVSFSQVAERPLPPIQTANSMTSSVGAMPESMPSFNQTYNWNSGHSSSPPYPVASPHPGPYAAPAPYSGPPSLSHSPTYAPPRETLPPPYMQTNEYPSFNQGTIPVGSPMSMPPTSLSPIPENREELEGPRDVAGSTQGDGTLDYTSYEADSLVLSRAPSGIFLPDFRSRSRAKRRQGCCDTR